MSLLVDVDVVNADWSKRTWDLPTDAAYWRAVPLRRLHKLVTLPAWDAAPKSVMRTVAKRLNG